MNQALREHVTRVGFDLTLGKTHIAALVEVNEIWAKDLHCVAYGRPWSHFAGGGVGGCVDRGLVWHQFHDARGVPEPKRPKPSEYYGLTTAGQYTVGLLAEAGVWQEYLDLLERHKTMGTVRVWTQEEWVGA